MSPRGEGRILDATELLCELLDTEEISRQELAQRLGKSKGFVSQVLSGERNMTLRTLSDIALALDCRLRLHAQPLRQSNSDAGSQRVFIAPPQSHSAATARRGLVHAPSRGRSTCSNFESIGRLWEQNARRKAADAKRDRTYSLIGS